jgi:hypothetical protein
MFGSYQQPQVIYLANVIKVFNIPPIILEMTEEYAKQHYRFVHQRGRSYDRDMFVEECIKAYLTNYFKKYGEINLIKFPLQFINNTHRKYCAMIRFNHEDSGRVAVKESDGDLMEDHILSVRHARKTN